MNQDNPQGEGQQGQDESKTSSDSSSLLHSSSFPRAILLPRRARPFHGRHPWVFAGAIDRVEGNPADGDEVDLVSHTGAFIARGLYNSKSKIRIRLYTWDENTTLDRDFFRVRLQGAIGLREGLNLNDPAGACRLVFSEGDFLSGLIVDRYARWLVLQFTSLALARRREMLADILEELVQPEGMYIRTEKGIGKLEGLEIRDGPFRGGRPGPLVIEEAGLRFRVNLIEGQKTGFYLDQRRNRLEVATLARGRSVLDAFCYSGGFGLHASRMGATQVLGIDQSGTALELAKENAHLNEVTNVEYVQGDVFEQLEELVNQGRSFGLIVLDPPKFARSRGAIEEALAGYRQLHRSALKLVEKGGILVSCCCSGLIAPAMLEELLSQVAASGRRDIQILERRGPSPDHPVSASCLESHYLKCLILRVN